MSCEHIVGADRKQYCHHNAHSFLRMSEKKKYRTPNNSRIWYKFTEQRCWVLNIVYFLYYMSWNDIFGGICECQEFVLVQFQPDVNVRSLEYCAVYDYWCSLRCVKTNEVHIWTLKIQGIEGILAQFGLCNDFRRQYLTLYKSVMDLSGIWGNLYLLFWLGVLSCLGESLLIEISALK